VRSVAILFFLGCLLCAPAFAVTDPIEGTVGCESEAYGEAFGWGVIVGADSCASVLAGAIGGHMPIVGVADGSSAMDVPIVGVGVIVSVALCASMVSGNAYGMGFGHVACALSSTSAVAGIIQAPSYIYSDD
jgi:hypothetical protein